MKLPCLANLIELVGTVLGEIEILILLIGLILETAFHASNNETSFRWKSNDLIPLQHKIFLILKQNRT